MIRIDIYFLKKNQKDADYFDDHDLLNQSDFFACNFERVVRTQILTDKEYYCKADIFPGIQSYMIYFQKKIDNTYNSVKYIK